MQDMIDRVYEASVVPELWEASLHEISASTQSIGGLLFVLRDAKANCIASPGAKRLWDGFVAGGWIDRNIRAERLLARQHAGWVHDLDLFTLEELAQEPVYIECFRKLGAGWGAGTAMELPNGDSIFFTIERAYDRGPFSVADMSQLDRLRPHLGRAAYLSNRLSLHQAQSTTAALGAVGTPAAVVRSNGTLLAANTEMHALIPDIFTDRKARFTLADKTADSLFLASLAQFDHRQDLPMVASIPIKGTDRQSPMVLHVLPVRRAAHDIFSGAAFIVIINLVRIGASPRASLLTALFDLTPAEARVARLLAELDTIGTIAAKHGVSTSTVRSQVKAIFAKTGLNSQAALVRLVGSLANVPPTDE